MNEDTFNMELRKFLKKVGITSQREVENAVRAALEQGILTGSEKLEAYVTLKIDRIGLVCDIPGMIALE
jgi:hypothetical protein